MIDGRCKTISLVIECLIIPCCSTIIVSRWLFTCLHAWKPLNKCLNLCMSSFLVENDSCIISRAWLQAIAHGESATLYANRSRCKLILGDGDGALSDALKCRMLRPKWAKACYRQGAAHIHLKVRQACHQCVQLFHIALIVSGHVHWFSLQSQEYKQACDALEDALKMDPGNPEIESELR